MENNIEEDKRDFYEISLIDLQRAYDKAVESNAEKFSIKGLELLTKYAYYLLEHLKNTNTKSIRYEHEK